MAKSARQNKILQLISEKDIGTQAELTAELIKEGFNITQATVSRDIKSLGLIKIASPLKGYKYYYPESNESNENNENKLKLLTIFRESVISIEKAINLIVLKTISGSANSACLIIDKLNIEGVAGTLAGDDTIIVIIKRIEDIDYVYGELNKLLRK